VRMRRPLDSLQQHECLAGRFTLPCGPFTGAAVGLPKGEGEGTYLPPATEVAQSIVMALPEDPTAT
jgi:hypothetical protein